MTAKKKATPKPAEQNQATTDERIANLTNMIFEEKREKVHLRDQYNELKQDYLELTVQISASATTANRILNRHNIGRSSTFVQGVNKPRCVISNQGEQ